MPFFKFFKKVTIELSSGLLSHEYLVLALSATTIKPDFYSMYYGVDYFSVSQLPAMTYLWVIRPVLGGENITARIEQMK